MTYFNTFANVWAAYQPSYAYYLYSSTGATSGGSSSSTTSTPPTAEGTLTFTQKPGAATAVANPADTNGGYSITYTDNAGKKTTLNYSQGQFVSDNSATPAICLKGTFTVKSQFTNQSSDSNTLMPVMAGTVNGVNVLGVNVKQGTGSGADDFWSLFHPTTLSGYISLFLDIFGVLQALQFSWEMLGKTRKGLTKLADWAQGKKPPPTEIEKLKASVEEMKATMEKNSQAAMDKLGKKADVKVPENAEAAIAEAGEKFKLQGVTKSAAVAGEALEAQAKTIEVAAELGVSEPLENAAATVRENMADLKAAASDPVKLAAAVEKVNVDIPKTNTALDTLVKQAAGVATEEQMDSMKESTSRLGELEEAQKQVSGEAEEMKEGPTGELEDAVHDIPEFK